MFSAFRIFILFAFPLSLLAQGVSWNIGLKSTLGRGQQDENDYNYFENFVTGSVEMGHWYFDLSLESSQPPEYGSDYQGLDRLFISYIGDQRSLEIGDISAVFGRGLALNLDENQAIDFDNEIMGLRFSSILFENHEIDFIAGVNDAFSFYSPSSELRKPDGKAAYELAGMEATINSGSGLWSFGPYAVLSRLESDYLWNELDPSTGSVNIDTVSQKMHAIQGGWGQSIYGNSWDVYLEYNRTWKAFNYPLVQQSVLSNGDELTLRNNLKEYTREAQALNIQVNWFPGKFTTMFEYKRYLQGPEKSSQKSDPLYQASKPLPWQMGPTGIREHDISLLGNVTHPVDYGDELGWNFEFRTDLSDNLSMVLNAAQTSQSQEVDPGFLPEQDLSLNPWQEYYAEFEYSGSSIYQRVLLAYTKQVLSGQSAAEIVEHYTLVPAYMSWHPSNTLVLSSVVELQMSKAFSQRYSGERLGGHNFSSGHFIASADFNHLYSASLIWDVSDDPSLNSGKHEMQNWISAEVSMKPIEGLWIRASYGKEKGGVRCTGGVCRVLNPFEGYRMTLEWRL